MYSKKRQPSKNPSVEFARQINDPVSYLNKYKEGRKPQFHMLKKKLPKKYSPPKQQQIQGPKLLKKYTFPGKKKELDIEIKRKTNQYQDIFKHQEHQKVSYLSSESPFTILKQNYTQKQFKSQNIQPNQISAYIQTQQSANNEQNFQNFNTLPNENLPYQTINQNQFMNTQENQFTQQDQMDSLQEVQNQLNKQHQPSEFKISLKEIEEKKQNSLKLNKFIDVNEQNHNNYINKDQIDENDSYIQNQLNEQYMSHSPNYFANQKPQFFTENSENPSTTNRNIKQKQFSDNKQQQQDNKISNFNQNQIKPKKSTNLKRAQTAKITPQSSQRPGLQSALGNRNFTTLGSEYQQPERCTTAQLQNLFQSIENQQHLVNKGFKTKDKFMIKHSSFNQIQNTIRKKYSARVKSGFITQNSSQKGYFTNQSTLGNLSTQGNNSTINHKKTNSSNVDKTYNNMYLDSVEYQQNDRKPYKQPNQKYNVQERAKILQLNYMKQPMIGIMGKKLKKLKFFSEFQK